MKKTTKLLCILLAFVMMSSSLAVGASAYQAYNTPVGYNSIGKPIYTYEQTCSMLLDFIDAKLFEANINETLDAKVTKIKLNLTSIDNTFQSLTDILNNGWLGVANFFSLLGDVKDLDGDAIESKRRSNTTDEAVFYALLEFLKDNKTPVANIVNDTFNWGLLDNFMKEDDFPYLFRTAAWLKETLYLALYNGLLKPESAPKAESLSDLGLSIDSFTLDEAIIGVLEKLLVGDYNVSTQSYSGFLPSMAGKLDKRDIDTRETYDVIQDLIDAAMNDILLPKLNEMLPDVLNINVSADWPKGNPEAPGLLPTIVGIVNDYLHLGYNYDEQEYPIVELNKLLTWLLVGTNGGDAAIYNIISFTDHGVDINDNLLASIKSLLRSLGPGLLQQFLPEYFPEDMEFPDLTNYTTDQLVSYVFGLLAPIYLPEVRILPGCDTIQECLTYFFISRLVDIMPEHDYWGMIANGTLDPENGAWVQIGTDYLIYVLNSVLPCELPADDNFDEMVSDLIDWALSEYGFAFNTRQDFSHMTAWEKIDATLFQIVDPKILTMAVRPGMTYSETLFKDVLIEGIQTLDLEKILSFVGKSADPSADLHLPLIKWLLGLLTRVFKSLMNGKDVMPAVTTIEDLVYTNSGRNLGTLISNLFATLYDERDYNFPTILPLVGQIIGLRSNASFLVEPPQDYPNKSVADLKNLMNTYVPVNGDIKYYSDDYGTFGEEDYSIRYKYKDFEDEYENCQDILERYEKNALSVTALELKNAYYRLQYYYNQLTARTQLCKIQLMRELEYAANNVPTENLVAGSDTGAKIYSDRSWRLYQEAKAFAESVYNATGIKQSKLSLARQQLFAAIANLAPYVRLARYVVLDQVIARAQNIPQEDYKLYTTSTIVEFKAALAAAVALDRDYDVNSQSIVDAAATRLNLAINGLTVWKLNYELNAEIVIDDVVAKDSNTVLKFREASGAAVTNVSATVNNGATIGAPYMEGDYYCWVITPTDSPLYTLITADISFTQPSTGKSYTAKAYTFVAEGSFAANINVNTCHVGKLRNAYVASLNGIGEATATTTAYNADHTNGGDAAQMASAPMGILYVDASQYQNLNQIPGLMFTITKYASSYSSDYIPGGTMTEVTIDSITSSNGAISLSDNSGSLTVNQTDSKNVTFAGAIPAAGGTIETTISAKVTARASNGGVDTSYPKFVLRVNAYDKSALRASVNKAITACRQEWFYSGGWEIYVRDLENAVAVLNNPISTQAMINEADDNLNEAIGWLEYKSADFARLHQLYCVATSLNPFDYQDFSAVTRILNTITYSQGMLQQSLVDETCDNLRAAIDNLQPAQSQINIRCLDISGNVIANGNGVVVNGDEVTGTLLSTDTIVGNVGEKVIIEVPEIIGYTSNDTKKLVTITHEGVTVEFTYTPDSYRVILNANGGTVSPTTTYVTYGSTYAGLPTPTREGYIFTGWYNKLSGGMVINETTKVTTSCYRTLYAHWDEDPDFQTDSIDTGAIGEAAAGLIKNKTISNFINTLISFLNKVVNFVLLRVLGISK